MKMHRALIGLFFVLLVVAGCSRKAAPSITSEVRDSIIIQYVPRTVEVKLPGDTVTLTEYIECDSVTNKPKPVKFNVHSKRAKVKVEIDSEGKLTATGGCDSLKGVIQLLDKEILRLRSEKRKEVQVVTEYKTRGIDIFCRCFTGCFFLLLTLFVLFKLKKLT